MFSVNFNLFYQIYDFLFSHNNAKYIAKIINLINLQKIIICDVGCYKAQFSKQIFKYLKNKNLFFYLFDANNNFINYYKELKFKYIFKKIAISNKKKKTFFYINNFFEASGSSLKKTSFNDKLYKLLRAPKDINKIKVTTNTLNNLIDKNITILKIDTEGGGTEFDCIKGASKLLRKIKVICIECQNNNKLISDDINKVCKYLDKHFNLVLKKRIWSVSVFTKLESYDLIFLNKKI
jgi:FkbM family methyltransferase